MKLVKCSIVVFIITLCVAVTTSSAKSLYFSKRIGTSRGGTTMASANKEYDNEYQTIKKISAEDNASSDDRDIDAKLTANKDATWMKLKTNVNLRYPDQVTYFDAGNPYSLHIRTSNIWVPTGCNVYGFWNLDAGTPE